MAMSSGASLYYVSDKNIFDALNQSKVDNETVRGMFERRNIVCSKHTPREELAKYFSSLTHDYLDHRDIAARLGVISRRERTTSVDIHSTLQAPQIDRATERLVAELRKEGDVVQVTKEGSSLSINIKYSETDYRQSEFRQIQHRDGLIELVKEGSGWVLRSTQSGHVDAARDQFVKELGRDAATPIPTSTISLFEYPSPKARSKFFADLMGQLAEYVRRDVTDIYVHKVSGQQVTSSGDDDEGDGDVQRVLMRGNSLTRSKLLTDLLKEDQYYIFKVGWLATEKLGKGYVYAIEASFRDPGDCVGFSYLVRGVYVLEENGKLSKTRRLPTKSESDALARSIEATARKLVAELAAAVTSQGGDHGKV